MFFIPVGHYGTPYSKPETPCTWPPTAFWRPAPRQLQSDGSLRLLTLRSSASDMLLSPINSMFSEVFRARDSTSDHPDSLAQTLNFHGFVSMREKTMTCHCEADHISGNFPRALGTVHISGCTYKWKFAEIFGAEFL